MITISAFKWVPPFAQGLVRDLRVRWALEEAGLPYEVKLLAGGKDQASPEYRACQPFGQVPIFEEDGLVLFESGAICLHLAARSTALFPADEAGRAKATMWTLCALNSLEIFIGQLAEIDLFSPNDAWAKEHRPAVVERIAKRLGELAETLGDREYLEDRFTVGDLMMTTVLRNLRQTDLVAKEPRLAAFQARCEARPAFQKALRDQLAVFAENAPPGDN